MTADKLQTNLAKHLDEVNQMKDQWPADANQAYEMIAHHVFMAFYDIDSSKAGATGGSNIRGSSSSSGSSSDTPSSSGGTSSGRFGTSGSSSSGSSTGTGSTSGNSAGSSSSGRGTSGSSSGTNRQ